MEKWSVFTFINILLLFYLKVSQSTFFWNFYLTCYTEQFFGMLCIFSILYYYSLQYSSPFQFFMWQDFYVQAIWIISSLFCGTTPCQVKPIEKTCSLLLVTIINMVFFINIPNNWSWGVLFTTRIKVFLGVVYHAWFIVWIF